MQQSKQTQQTDQRTDNEPVLEAEGLTKHFTTSEGLLDRYLTGNDPVQAVDDVDLCLHENETLAIVGESGCGKSTLCRTILRLVEPTDGTIRFRGQPLDISDDAVTRAFRREVQPVFQDPLASLNPRHTVRRLLTTPMKVHGVCDTSAARRERAVELLENVGLTAQYLDRYPSQLSGGQQQRIAIARALTVNPSILIADEPASGLDVSVQAQVLTLLDRLQAQFGLAILFVTHNLSIVRHTADRVGIMYLGHLVEKGPVAEIFQNSKHPYTRALLSAIPRIDPSARADRELLQGTVPDPTDPPNGCRFHTRCPVVIPPDEWQADTETFITGYRFRQRVAAGLVDPAAIEVSADVGDKRSRDDVIADRLVARHLEGPVTEQPPEAKEAIRAAAAALVKGREEWARTRLCEVFSSPCERDRPKMTMHGNDHAAACYRVDPMASGDPDYDPASSE